MTNKILINGEWRDGGGEEFTSYDPSTGEAIWTGQAATKSDVSDAVSSARAAFEKWALTPLGHRIEIMERYRDLIKRDADDLARLISRETGKPLWETKTEAAAVAGKIDISIKAYHDRTGEHLNAAGATNAVLRHKPHGVMAVLGPYNFPAHLANGHMVPALIAGNTVVFKPSELTPGPGAFIMERMVEAGVPEGVVNLVQGGRETGAALTDADVNGVLFTGGVKTGLAIHKQFDDRLDVILALELGGNNPLIWWDTENVDAAAFAVVQSAFLTSGQRCTCARRLIVPEGAVGDKAIEALTKLTDRLIIGAPFDDPQPFMGPVITPKVAEGLERAFDQLLDQDGEAIRNLSVRDEGTAFVSPGIVDVTRSVSVPDEEHFGPLLKVWRVADFDEAIARANKTKFGLSAGLLSDDKAKWEKFLALSRAGIVNWNRQTTGAAGSAPFGGIGASGNHRPAAYYAADYCAYPVASMEGDALLPLADDQVGVR
ncbi:succinylglutamate-semialdehyde dehydrogenase [Hyphococcus flavus]|uniref:N-succinylglutamate 5-semialdehyde dehydrogenase n=1 Tax=Hyphococcus flavus TaxID=1866326 RepID=A0AAE9ZAU7_9PROT|nr:succinylglutamate-semialdehyde dehydrogenase [Hyphococcus flavus]WDI30919.1 succinylglutamate-semialdehyde dehydrogenase [Hyphococcus flavus]